MTGPIAGGFAEGDDYVALRLNLDIPQEGVAGVREITQEVERYKVAMEAAIRAEADMSRYADQMAESTKRAAEAQQNLTQQLQTYLQLSGEVSAGGHGYSSGVPAGPHKAPWESGTAGTGAAPVPPGARMPNPSDVIYQLGDRAGGTPKDAASYLNMHHVRGNVPETISISPESIQNLAAQIAERERAVIKQDQTTRPNNVPQRQPHPAQRHPSQSDPFDQFEQRVQNASGLAGQVMNEMAGGGGGGGMGQLAIRGLDWARKKLEERAARTDAKPTMTPDDGGSGDPATGGADKASDIAGIAKMLGIGGGVATAALAAFGLYEKGGQMMQGWRNIASPRGGGAGEGFELAMRQRMLSMDPNISTGQSREIYQAMLSEGYADASGGGPQADQIKEYLKTNIKQYNMDVSESMQLLKLSAHTTKVSVGDLNEALFTLQQMAKGTQYVSQQELQRNFQQRWAQLEAQGVPEAAAMRSAMQAGGIFLNDPKLAGTWGQTNFTPEMGMMQGLFGGPGGTPMTNIPSNITPDLYGAWNQNMGTGNENSMQVLKTIALRCRQDFHDNSGGTNPEDPFWFEASHKFAEQIRRYIGPESPLNDVDEAVALYNVLAWGIDAAGNATSSDPKEIIHQGNIATMRPKLEVQTIDHAPKTGYLPGIGSFPIGPGGREHIAGGKEGAEQKLIDVFGKENIQVVNPDGSVWDLDTGNADQAAGIAAGKYKLRRKGDEGKGMRLADIPLNVNENFSMDHPKNPAGLGSSNKSGDKGGQVSGELTIKIDRNGNVSAPSSVPLTANEDASNKGAGDAQRNNPPIGDQILGGLKKGLDFLTAGTL